MPNKEDPDPYLEGGLRHEAQLQEEEERRLQEKDLDWWMDDPDWEPPLKPTPPPFNGIRVKK